VLGLGDAPLVLFGHCMGALSAHALAAELFERGKPATALVVSSSRVPHLPPEQRYLPPRPGAVGVYHMSMDQPRLREEISRVMAAQGVEVPDELLGIAVRVLDRDLDMCFGYSPGAVAPTGCPVHAVAWSDDSDVAAHEMLAWSDYGTAFCLSVLPGHKMSFIDAGEELMDVIRSVSSISRPTAQKR